MSDPVSIDAVLNLIGALNGPNPDFIMRNGGWLITVIGVIAACVGGVLSYFLKSRCREISCLCLSCKRQVVDLSADEADVTLQG